MSRVIIVNTAGPQGAVGPQGPIGPSGSVGAQGPSGSTGSQGETGPQGPQGIQGASAPFYDLGSNTWNTTSSIQISGSLTVSGSSTFTNIGPAIFSGSVTINGSPALTQADTGSLTVLSASYSTTAGTANAVSQLNQNVTIVGDLSVFGTASYSYTTASQLDVGTNYISVNVAEPGERFGGLKVYDSGSLSHMATASLSWDSLNNRWIYQNASGSTYSGGMLISGPRNTGSMGNEVGTTLNALMKGQGGDHITSSGIFEDSSGSVTFGNNLMYISSSGFVGIGTSNPSYPLHIVGDGIQLYNSSSPTQVAYYRPQFLDVYGSTRFEIITNNAGLDLNSRGGGDIRFLTTGSVRMFISSSGNIGIGTNTTSSAYRLQVDASGSSNSPLPLALTSVDVNNRVGILFASSSTSAGKQHRLFHRVNTPTVEWLLGASTGETAGWRFLPRDDTNYGVNILAPFNGGTSYLNTGLSQSLFSLGAGSQTAQHINISSSGNVGIGTTIPGVKLDVSGDVRASNTVFASETATRTLRINSFDNLAFLNSGSVEVARFENSGNWGFGTTSPLARLDIRGTQIATGAIARTMLISSSLSASANNDVLVGLDINPTFTIGAFTGVTQIGLRVAGTIIPTINTGFNIGTNSAAYGRVFSARFAGTSISDVTLSTTGTTTNLNFQLNDSAGNIVGRFFNTTGNLTLQNGGTFTDAGYRLDVSGSVRVSGGIFGIGTSGTILPLINTAGTGTVVVGGTSPNTPALRLQGSPLNFFVGNTQVAQLFATTGNLTLQNGGTFTDAGFRLDVSGSGRFTDSLQVTGSLNVQGDIKQNGVSLQALSIAYAIALG